MNCDETSRISELIDGELPAEESERMLAHVDTCAECQSAREDFLFFRQEIKSLAQNAPENSQAVARQNLWQEFFKRRIRLSLSMPVFASLMLAIVALAALTWTIILRKSESGTIAVETSNTPAVKREKSATENGNAAQSLARFDGGGRAEIFAVQKISPGIGN